ncbi:MAG: PAS domain S-box protein [Candidatus Thermoplasmatota archaeon]
MVKFIFIFFFQASYEPRFIFDLTPLYLLSGFSNMQLLSLSLLVIAVDTGLHLQANKRNLLLSFLPTVLMLCSLAVTIMFNPMEITYVFHYLLFGCLLLILLIDYQYILKGVQAPTFFRRREPTATNKAELSALIPPPPPLLVKPAPHSPAPPAPVLLHNVAEFERTSEAIVQRIHAVLDDLERKTKRVEQLEKTFEQQHSLFHHTPPSPVPFSTPLPSVENPLAKEDNLQRTFSAEERIVIKERIENHLIVNDPDPIVAVVQRGVFKEISHALAEFLGYERTELLQKNFFVFIAPSGFEDARKYYLNRLKGSSTNSFRTVFLAKTRTELPVEITVVSTIHKGDSADFITIKHIKGAS